MVETIKDYDGKVVALIAWQVVNEEGQYKDQGDYIYIEDLWIHRDARGNGVLRRLINLIDKHKFATKAKWVYWEREKYNHRISKRISRKKITRGDKHV